MTVHSSLSSLPPAKSGWQPLGPAQQRLWFFSRLEPDSDAYHLAGLWRFSGVLNDEALRYSLDCLLARHAILRTRLRERDGIAEQNMGDIVPMPLELVVLEGATDEELQRQAGDFIAQPFDLFRGPLVRCQLYCLGADRHVLVMVLHHMVFDAWSLRRLMAELAEGYRLFLAGEVPPDRDAAGLDAAYAACVQAQRDWLDGDECRHQLDFWRSELAGEAPALSLSPDNPRPAGAAYRARYYELRLPAALVAQLQALASACRATPFNLLLAALQLQLARLSGQPEVRVGVPVANRTRDNEALLGFHVNTVVLAGRPQGRLSVRQWLGEVRARLRRAQAHRTLPLERLVEELQPERRLGQQPLFQIAFNYRHDEPLPADWLPGLETVFDQLSPGEIPFDLALDAVRGVDGGLSITVAWAEELFEAASIERLVAGFVSLLEQFVADPERRLAELDLLDAAQRTQLEAWNVCRQSHDPVRLLPELIAEQARRRPDAVALVHGETRVSYAELEARANRLARQLIACGVGPEARVGLCLERGTAMIEGLLAILKAGGAFVPLDPDYPRERLAYMAEDSGLKWLLTTSGLRGRLPLGEGVEALCLDLLDSRGYDATPPAVAIHPQNLAYLIYTSGSTGQPKGVAVNHAGLSMHVQTIGQRYGMTPDDVELHFASISFDGALERWAVPLAFGSRLVIRDQELWTAEQTCAVLQQEGVTIACFPPSYVGQLLDWIEAQHLKLPVHSWTLGGEAFTRETYERLQRVLQPKRIVNGYGPTETVVTPLIWEAFPGTALEAAYAPIGTPVGPRRLYVLDGELNPLPLGVAGELYIGGEVGLARGYHQRPELTAERFLPDPFGAPGERMYRTGDLVRWREDGALDYLGRLDQQVKIRGFRIELGEIESRLLAHESVVEAAVIARETPAGRQLVGYLVPRGPLDPLEIRQRLAEALPDYMVPAQLVVLERLPLTPAGKLDRAALPAPQWQVQGDYQAPQTEPERILAEIWAQLLGLPRVGRQDRFFELGGDSIVALQVVGRARQAGLGLTPRDVFQQQSLAALAVAARPVAAPRIEQGPAEGAVPLLPIQARLLERQGTAPCNQYLLFELAENLEPILLEQALQALVAHHDALRLRFAEENGVWRQWYGELNERHELLWLCEVAGEDELAVLGAEAQRSLDPQAGPLLRACWLSQAGCADRLLLAVHHLAVDGVSWRILLEDLLAAYRQLAAGQRVALPARTSAFKAWAERLQDWAADPAQAQRAFWQAQERACAQLPLLCRESAREGQRQRLELNLSAEFSRELLQAAQQAYRLRADEVLLTALSRVLCAWSEQCCVCLHLESHGRAPLFDELDLSRTVGWFTSLYLLRLQPAADLPGSLKAIKEQLRAVRDGGLAYGLLRRRGELDGVAPQVLFNYLGQFEDDSHGPLRLLDAGLWREAAAPLDAPLCIDAELRGGALRLRLEFSPSQWQRSTLEGLLQRLQDELRAIRAHCTHAPAGLTPNDVPLAGLDQARLDALHGVEDLYPLSPLQQGLLFHSRLGGAGSYVNQLCLPLSGLDPARLRRAWEEVLARHAILRSGFLDGEAPLQAVHGAVELPWQELDWRAEADFDAALQAFCAAERARGFDLARPPLLRLALLRRGERDWLLVWTLHHLLLDGWSTALLLGELLALYHGERPAAPHGQFGDYIAWLARRDGAADEAFWRARLQGFAEPGRVAGSLVCRTPGEGPARHPLPLAAEQATALRGFAQRHGLTLNSLIQGAWALLLGRLTGRSRVCFGTTVAGRPAELAGSERLPGLFINTLPVPVALPAAQPLGAWLAALQADNLALREHEHTPLYDIQRWAGRAGEALFDSLLVFENYPLGDALRQAERGGLRLGAPQSHEATHYPLTLAVLPGEALELLLAYDRAHFDEEGIGRLAGLLRQILAELVGDPARRLAELDLLDAVQRAQLEAWNACRQIHDPARLLPDLIAEQARLRPEAIALVHGETRVSYAELEARANRLAHHLVACGVGPEARVGLCLERSTAMIEGLLAILKAGGAFVPLDPDYPRERLAYMAEDSGLKWLITTSALRGRLPLGEGVEALCLDLLDTRGYVAEPPAVRLHPQNLAYLIYTSGSTGRPKGVAVDHAGLTMHVQTIGQRYGMTAEDVELHFASISFDGAVERWTVPLAFGSRLVIRDQELWSAEQTCDVLQKEGVTIACFPPSYVGQLLDWIESQQLTLPVRSWTLGGEAFTRETYERLQKVLQPQRIINGYGPTETVVTPLIWEAFPGTALDAAYAPVGTPVGPRRLYVLDGELNPLPLGVAGELYIGGEVGLARGYHQRPELTAERFLPDPFGSPGERMYRTGDLVRWRDDGALDYLGRLDQQVKIRGFRIELGEIESRLLAHESVVEAAVIARETPAGRQLVGYLVPRGPLDPLEIRQRLAEALPDYMVPAQLVVLERLPLTPAGKLDRAALPEPQWQASDDYEAPQGDSERILAEIWAQLLGLERVGRNDRFFELGGDSIVALQVVSRLRSGHGLALSLAALFEAPCLAGCAARIAPVQQPAPALRSLPRSGALLLSHAQRRLWFLARLEPENTAYHMPAGLDLHGRLDRAALQAGLDLLAARHESLRTRFVEADGEPRQLILPPTGQAIVHHDLAELAPAEREAAVQAITAQLLHTPFDLARQPLLRVALLRLGEDRHRLLLVQHHIVSDGWSLQRFIDEFCRAYAAFAEGREPRFDPLPLQYADYAQWQRDWLAGGEGARQLDYWRAALGEYQPLLELPADHPRPPHGVLRGARLRFEVPEALTARLRALTRRENATLFAVLLAAWQSLLHRYSGQEDIRVGVPVAGRSLPETEGVLGCFVNTLVLRGTPSADKPFRQLLGELQQASREALAHQELPFDQLVEALQPQRSLGHHPLFQVAFNHQTVDFSALHELPGLRVAPFDPGAAGAQFDLGLDTEEDPDGRLSGFVGYACELFETPRIERLVRHFLRLLEGLCDDPEQAIGRLPLLSAEEEARIAAWNHTERDYGPFVPVTELIARQAAATPDAPALAFGARRLSYAELDAAINRLARRLRARGVGPGVPVGISLERSVELVLGLHAIVRAGGAYVPLDPDYPAERLAYLLEDSGIALLLGHSRLLDGLPLPDGLAVLCLDTEDCGAEPATPPAVVLQPDDLAYVIYTSGSTGQPKGAGNSHAALANRLLWMQEAYRIGPGDCVLQKTPFSFDVSVWEFFWPLMTGACLAVAAPGDHRDPQRLVELIDRHRVTTLHFVPSMLQAFVAHPGIEACTSLTRILCSGEALPVELQARAFQRLPGVALHNLYGPTEAAIDVSHWACVDEGRAAVPIGRPIANLRLHILDGQLNRVPVGVPGELYLAGIGLARGYHRRPALTAERFLPDPFGPPGSRMYRTGDLARWREDGVVDYLGRIDHQVKIRGFRVELGEIEALLAAQAGVAEAVVVARDTQIGKQLVGYLVADGEPADEAAWLAGLRAALKAALPEHMVPAALVRLARMPLSPNGKLERRALPEPHWQTRRFRAPQSALEQALAAIWEELLEVPRVGLEDNFFELGGHSLLATRAVALLRQRLDLEVPLRAFFELDSLAALAESLAPQAPAGAGGEDGALQEMAALLDELEAL
ncbi:non-ribosomal peptide synthetase [Azotobacter chroococcum]|uniref:Non-ribosomal peptide synthase, PvdJ(2)-like protein n=1 Tax=Azotobacter chroococcum NCIMB 8003 TaxID=1328314 RepID=A0A0C4WVC8_9GAMM|nr:non-ribosomal peptide synthetase [Azotobacter chroococcum]AJE23910.1 Non-ribosomal peptide synthase, PvdJ(2)-like protein [Azotobacter chroococcum NCIMB 8003]